MDIGDVREKLVAKVKDSFAEWQAATKLLNHWDKIIAQSGTSSYDNPVILVGGKHLLRGCFEPSGVCSKYINVEKPFIQVNRIDDVDRMKDTYDDNFKDAGMVKVEWYNQHGEYTKGWVSPDMLIVGK